MRRTFISMLIAVAFSPHATFAEAHGAQDLEPAFAQLRKAGVRVLVVLPGSWFASERHRILELALRHQLPAVGGGTTFAEAGALISYGFDRSYNFRRAAWYADQILRGTKPGDLPIGEPAKFEFAVNLRTAKALGVAIPPTVMVRADRIIN